MKIPLNIIFVYTHCLHVKYRVDNTQFGRKIKHLNIQIAEYLQNATYKFVYNTANIFKLRLKFITNLRLPNLIKILYANFKTF